MKSEVDFELDGVRHGFKFGTYTGRLIEEKSGLKLSDFLQKMAEYDLDIQSKFYFCCALHWCKSNKVNVDFDQADVDDWRDELGEGQVILFTEELLKQYSIKNLNPPVTGEALV